MKIRNAQILLSLVLCFIAFINILTYSHMGYMFGGDEPLSIPKLQTLYYSFFGWTSQDYSGYSYTASTPLGIVFYSIDVLCASVAGSALATVFSMWLYYALGAVGMFLLVFELTRRFSNIIAYFSGFITALFFILNFGTNLSQPATITTQIPYLFFTSSAPAMFMPYIVLSLLFLSRAIEKRENPNFALGALSLSTALLLAFGGVSFTVQDSIFLIATFVFSVLIAGRKIWLKQAKCIVVAGVLALVADSPLLFTTYLTVGHALGQYVNGVSYSILVAVSYNILESLLGFIPETFSFLTLGLPITAFLIISIFMIAFAGAASVMSGIKRITGQGKIVVMLLFDYLVLVFISNTVNPPFGLVFNVLLKYFPYLTVLRYPGPSTFFIYLFLITALFGFGSGYMLNILKRNKKLLTLASLYLILITVAYIYAFDVPIVVSAQFPQIPGYVENITGTISSDSSYFAVATLPATTSAVRANWYDAPSIYSSLLNSTVYTGGEISSTEIFFPLSKSYYWNFGYEVDNSNTSTQDLSNLFGVFGIKYIIVQGDFIGGYNIPPFNISRIYANLNASNGITIQGKYSTSAIYVDHNYLDLVYPANIYYLNNGSEAQVLTYIENNSFDIYDYFIGSKTINKQFNSTGNVTEQIPSMSEPRLTYVEQSPVTVIVNVTNATTPFYLVFLQTYDNGWIASYANGTMINSSYHIVANGFANAWYVGKLGSYSIRLYYEPQTAVNFLWILSIASIAIMAVMMYVGVARKVAK